MLRSRSASAAGSAIINRENDWNESQNNSWRND
jgi:hypothetical protein